MAHKTLLRLINIIALAAGLYSANGHADDMSQALAAYQAGRYQEAYRLWVPLAEQDNANAQYNLGLLYRHGRGVGQNDRQALLWFSRAAQQGLLDAQYNTGLMYMEGRGVAVSKRDALQWWQLAADKGHAASQYNLGVLYAYGLATAVDTEKALTLWQQAAAQGHQDARAALYRVYSEGLLGEKPDPERAQHWRD